MATEIISRAEAQARGLKRYFTGKECKHGHVNDRQVSNGACVTCRADIEDRWKKANPEKLREKLRRQAARHRKENPERVNRNKRKWAAANPEKILEKGRHWVLKNPERHAANTKRWRDAHPEHVAKKNKTYKTLHAERLRPIAIARTKKWQEDNPEKKREQARKGSHTRRARKYKAGGSYTNAQINELLEKQKWKCAGHGCRASLLEAKELDHVVAIAKGGSNDITNLQWLCPPCNRRKRDKDPIVWAQENGRLL